MAIIGWDYIVRLDYVHTSPAQIQRYTQGDTHTQPHTRTRTNTQSPRFSGRVSSGWRAEQSGDGGGWSTKQQRTTGRHLRCVHSGQILSLALSLGGTRTENNKKQVAHCAHSAGRGFEGAQNEKNMLLAQHATSTHTHTRHNSPRGPTNENCPSEMWWVNSSRTAKDRDVNHGMNAHLLPNRVQRTKLGGGGGARRTDSGGHGRTDLGPHRWQTVLNAIDQATIVGRIV